MKVLQWQKGCDMRVKDECRQGEVKEGRARRNKTERKTWEKRERWCVTYRKERERRTETIIALSYHCAVINFSLVREPGPKLGPGLMTNHFHTALRSWLFMIRQLIKASWASIHLGLVLLHLGSGDKLKWGCTVVSCLLLLCPQLWQTLQDIIILLPENTLSSDWFFTTLCCLAGLVGWVSLSRAKSADCTTSLNIFPNT